MPSVFSLFTRSALTTLATVGLLTVGTEDSQAFTLGTPTAAQVEALNPETTYTAESRWGSGTVGGATFELDIHQIDENGGFVNDDQAEFDWVSGEAVDFSLMFDGMTLTYTVGNQVLSTTTTDNSFSEIYLRAAARKEGSSILLSNLNLIDETNSGALTNLDSSCSNGNGCGFFDAKYLHITHLTGAFTLTGQSTMVWDPNHLPRNSNLAYQIKLVPGTDTSTPEPTALMGLGLISALGIRKIMTEA
ncbi:MAG: choice-of-anchor W domain-containing protein [Cyanobacteria bacterium J06632_22]